MRYTDWLEQKQEQKKDAAGGLVPENMERAKKVDLITLPPDVEGTNCFNCKWVGHKKGDVRFCEQPQVKQLVNKRMCCAKWDRTDINRPWGDISV
jgi:hypothetical protein